MNYAVFLSLLFISFSLLILSENFFYMRFWNVNGSVLLFVVGACISQDMWKASTCARVVMLSGHIETEAIERISPFCNEVV